jgi:hypothetical protein
VKSTVDLGIIGIAHRRTINIPVDKRNTANQFGRMFRGKQELMACVGRDAFIGGRAVLENFCDLESCRAEVRAFELLEGIQDAHERILGTNRDKRVSTWLQIDFGANLKVTGVRKTERAIRRCKLCGFLARRPLLSVSQTVLATL